ncbi:MAG: hypothetical protein MK102_00460 [Fuerstiella sp.]|nr:hypothetical protein [Fuerstiella sp.]
MRQSFNDFQRSCTLLRPPRAFNNREMFSVSQMVVTATLLALTTTTTTTAAELIAPSGTKPLTPSEDPAEKLVAGVDRFLLKQIAETRIHRNRRWHEVSKQHSVPEDFIESRRKELTEILGLRESRVQFGAVEFAGATVRSAQIASCDTFRVEQIRWPVLTDPDPGRPDLVSVTGEGLLLTPTERPIATVIAIPDADQTPEQLCGLIDGIADVHRYVLRLANAGCQVFVPAITSRHVESRNGRSIMTDREFIYRSSFVLGQHLIGYELQKVSALVDMVCAANHTERVPVGIVGYGEGGMLSLFAGALDPRISATAVSGFFGPREDSWQEPLDRNVFGLLNDFGAAQLAAMLTPRPLLVETANVPTFEFTANGGAPARLTAPSAFQVKEEVRMALSLGANIKVISPSDGAFGSTEWLQQFVNALTKAVPTEISSNSSVVLKSTITTNQLSELNRQRRLRQLQELDRHNQAILRESPFVRKAFMANLDTSSIDSYLESMKPYRKEFRDNVIGRFDIELLPPNARSRKLKETEVWTAYEVSMDVFPDVTAYGVLLVPKNLKPDERRPVVVCQHGLEGRPLDTISDDHPAYHDFTAKLCERGFITFAPQNIYIFEDQFRTLQRKANPLGKTLFSVMVPQHQQIVNWLKSQPFVDGNRIAFYGLSYGGKSAMRIPALVTEYCLSICSADFNEWVLKNASTRDNFSYVWHGEYEIFEWNLGRTFNYSEMAALICPRPFMVERGHFDTVGEDDWVGFEYGKVRHLYAARLKIPERTEIEWFDGPHTINGLATFEFLHRHLNW